MHDDHLADALRTLNPIGSTTAQVSTRVDTLAAEVLRLRTVVRSIASIAGLALAVSSIECVYLIGAAR